MSLCTPTKAVPIPVHVARASVRFAADGSFWLRGEGQAMELQGRAEEPEKLAHTWAFDPKLLQPSYFKVLFRLRATGPYIQTQKA